MPSERMLALVTITAAFQRTKARMRRSMCSSPGNQGSWSGGMVLTYGVDTVAGKPTCSSRARSSSFINKNRARDLPWLSTMASKESIHSPVTDGSMSGSWWAKPSKITGSTGPCSRLDPGSACRGGRFGEDGAVTTTVYTDGACLGNPGPGGWAWAVKDGAYRSGAEAQTTNQRMEIHAALSAVTSIEG